MDIQIKYLIIERLMQTKDDHILNQVKELLGITDKDWWEEISIAERQAIEQGIRQLDQGQGTAHEEVMKRVNKRFFKKK